MRKILAILLALTMVVGLGVSAWAGSIKITTDGSYSESNEERTYTAYKIFDATYDSNSSVNAQAATETIYIQATEYTDGVDYYVLGYVEAGITSEAEFEAGTFYTQNDDGTYTEATEYDATQTYYEKGYVKSEDEPADWFTTAETYDASAVYYKLEDGKYVKADVADEEEFTAARELFTFQPEETLYTAVANSANNIAYTIDAESPWVDVIGSFNEETGEFEAAEGQTWFTLTKIPGDETKYTVTLNEGVDTTTEVAQAIAQYLYDNIPDGAAVEEIALDVKKDVDNGYYLIVADDGATNLTLVTTDVEIIEKNTYMTTDKTTAQTSYKIGDEVTYTVDVVIPSGAALTEEADAEGNYPENHGPIILHDKMDEALTFAGTVTAKLEGDDFSGYELVKPEGEATALTDGCTFELVIPITEAMLGKTITFTYKATVNEKAATDKGLVNELFGENNGYETPKDKPVVYVFDFDVTKIFVGDENNEGLVATFELTDEGGNKITVSEVTDEEGEVVENAYVVDPAGTATITLTNGAKVNILGLKAGVYYLTELTTSNGYNMLTEPVTIVITDTTTFNTDGTINGDPSHDVYTGEVVKTVTAVTEFVPGTTTYYVEDEDGTLEITTGEGDDAVTTKYSAVTLNGKAAFAKYLEENKDAKLYTLTVTGTEKVGDAAAIEIENKSGTVLPSTGGIGTTIFYIVGGLLAVGAGVVLVTKKRMSKEDI